MRAKWKMGVRVGERVFAKNDHIFRELEQRTCLCDWMTGLPS